jgi:hypothetical protein
MKFTGLDSPVMQIVHVRWLTVVGTIFGSRAPLVKEDPLSDWNLDEKHTFENIRHAKSYNVAMWKIPQKLGHYVVVTHRNCRMFNDAF